MRLRNSGRASSQIKYEPKWKVKVAANLASAIYGQEEPMKWSPEARILRAAAVRRVHQDREVTHGAFRFYYLLAYQYADETGQCWPGQRALQKAMHCSTRSLGAWTVLLCNRKHLSTKKIRTRYGLARLYTLWRAIPEGETPGVSTLSGGVSTSGNETNYYKHRTIEKGDPPVAWQVQF